jgi:hypothetical protein
VPKRWHFLIKLAEIEAETLAARRRIFGDGDGYYIHMAALSMLQRELFEWDMLASPTRGAQIEDFILKAAAYVITVLGDRSCNSFDEYWALAVELSSREHREAVQGWLYP